jgi:hypothetical protein
MKHEMGAAFRRPPNRLGISMEQARVWGSLDVNKVENWRAPAVARAALCRIHVGRAKLQGLDEPQKLEVRGI